MFILKLHDVIVDSIQNSWLFNKLLQNYFDRYQMTVDCGHLYP